MTAPERAHAEPGHRLSEPFLGTWQLSIDTPIGPKCTSLQLWNDSLRTVGTIVDLFDSPLPIEGLCGDAEAATWRLELHKPLRITLHFTLKAANGELIGWVDAADIRMACIARR